MAEEERPVHVVVDCSPPPAPVFDEDGNEIPADVPPRVTQMPLSDKEWVQRQALSAQYAADQQLAAATADELAQAAAAHPDPLVQELARRAGILP